MGRASLQVVPLLLAAGCFAEVTAAYVPKLDVQVAQPSMTYAHREGAALVAVHVGFALDLFGVGLSYSGKYVGGTAVSHASGLPERIWGNGWRLRGDVTLPVSFGPHRLLGLRATAAYQAIEQATVGPDSSGSDYQLPATGSTALLGISATIPTHDAMFTLGAVRSTLHTEGTAPWPALDAAGWGIGASIHVRFVPVTSLTRFYVHRDTPPTACDSGSYVETCEYRGIFGTTCTSRCAR